MKASEGLMVMPEEEGLGSAPGQATAPWFFAATF